MARTLELHDIGVVGAGGVRSAIPDRLACMRFMEHAVRKPFIGGLERRLQPGLSPGRIPHYFRRTVTRNLVQAGVSEVVAMKMTGRKTRSIFDRYDIVSLGDLNDAARKLEEHMVTKTVTVRVP